MYRRARAARSRGSWWTSAASPRQTAQRRGGHGRRGPRLRVGAAPRRIGVRDRGRARALRAAVARDRHRPSPLDLRAQAAPTLRAGRGRHGRPGRPRCRAGRGPARAGRSPASSSRACRPPRSARSSYPGPSGSTTRAVFFAFDADEAERTGATGSVRRSTCRSTSSRLPTATWRAAPALPPSAHSRPDVVVSVVMPELIFSGWPRLLHNQRALYIKRCSSSSRGCSSQASRITCDGAPRSSLGYSLAAPGLLSETACRVAAHPALGERRAGER